MPVTLIPQPSKLMVDYVCHNMRDRDFEEVFALRWDDDPEKLAEDTYALRNFAWCAVRDGVPTALIGAFPRWPRVWNVFAFGTDEWNSSVVSLTRHARNFMMPAIANTGAYRVECHAMETHTDARAWLRKNLKASEGPTLDNYGKNGQNFVCYYWTRETTKGTAYVRD